MSFDIALGKQAPRGHYRRYLPHRDIAGLVQMITYRLADSLPRHVLERIAEELHNVAPEEALPLRRAKIEQWLDAGHGSCVLRNPEVATLLINNWQHFQGKRYDLLAWVVMPNHVHLLIRPYPGASLPTIVQSWKGYTGRRIMEMSRAQNWGIDSVWMREYWDRYIRDSNHLAAAMDYIHNNPVNAGLTKDAGDWPWSSATSGAPGAPSAGSRCLECRGNQT